MSSVRYSSVSLLVRSTSSTPNPSRRRSLSSDAQTVFGFIGYHEPQIIPTTGVALLDTNNAFIKAAAIVSLATNALATALTAYKMWYVL